jgi:hypothetical protein
MEGAIAWVLDTGHLRSAYGGKLTRMARFHPAVQNSEIAGHGKAHSMAERGMRVCAQKLLER